MLYIRSALFSLGMIISTCLWAMPCLLAGFFSYRICCSMVSAWCIFNINWARLCCGIRYEISGLENVPAKACVIISNHQSTWETLMYPCIFPGLTWVIKKELLYIPLFGWGMASTQPIALNRRQGKKAMRRLIKEGVYKLGLGRSILIFPEGTRVPHGEQRALKIGGFVLAKESRADILPVAHDAGRLWPRKSFIKRPGTVHLRIGKVICTQHHCAEQLRAQYAQWLDANLRQIAGQSKG